jgi:hypothetical protein
MKRLLIVGIMMTFFFGCQSSTFLIVKENDTRAYRFGSTSKRLKRILCESGDFEKVLRDAAIPDNLKPQFYEYVCTEKVSKEKVVSLYQFLTPEERKSLKRSFVKHGYTVNYVPC